MQITVISDTHNKHKILNEILPGGDLLIHAGDLSSMGYAHEIERFCKWFDSLDTYDHKVFIAGNHDFLFENHPEEAASIVNSYKWITYLQDTWLTIGTDDLQNTVKLYGSPWQPEFMHWAFNLPHNGPELTSVWNDIPNDTNILITHGPPRNILDQVKGRPEALGCGVLESRIQTFNPSIHVFGHIHTGNGYYFDGLTHYFNASILDESYLYRFKPRTFDWDPKTNKLEFIND